MKNRLYEAIVASRNGQYCHCLELDGVEALQNVIENIVEEYKREIEAREITVQEVVDFFATMDFYYYPVDGEPENPEAKKALYDASVGAIVRDAVESVCG